MQDNRPRQIYWLRHKSHTDLFTQGYIGVSVNPNERFRHHLKNAIGNYHSDKVLSKAIQKYGKDQIEMDILLTGDEKYCYLTEKLLRPNGFIGWNMREGGYHTPNPYPKGSKQPKESLEKRSNTLTEMRKTQSVGRNRKVSINGEIFNSIKAAREKYGISPSHMKRRLNGINYVNSGYSKFRNLEIKYAI